MGPSEWAMEIVRALLANADRSAHIFEIDLARALDRARTQGQEEAFDPKLPLPGLTEDGIDIAVTLDGVRDGYLIFTGGEELPRGLRIFIGYDDRPLVRAWGGKLEGTFRMRLEMMPEDDDKPAEPA